MNKPQILRFDTTFNQILFMALGCWKPEELAKELSGRVALPSSFIREWDLGEFEDEAANAYWFLGQFHSPGYHLITLGMPTDHGLMHEISHQTFKVLRLLGIDVTEDSGEEIFCHMIQDTYQKVAAGLSRQSFVSTSIHEKSDSLE